LDIISQNQTINSNKINSNVDNNDEKINTNKNDELNTKSQLDKKSNNNNELNNNIDEIKSSPRHLDDDIDNAKMQSSDSKINQSNNIEQSEINVISSNQDNK